MSEQQPAPDSDLPRRCRRTRSLLPNVKQGGLSMLRHPRTVRHLGRCADCSAELDRQTALTSSLQEVASTAAPVPPAPPEGLLDTLLEQASDPGVRARAAVPIRGAVSGARPELTAALIALSVCAAVLAGYLTWRVGRAIVGSRTSSPPVDLASPRDRRSDPPD